MAYHRSMEIDYSFSQLPEDELAELLERRQSEAAEETRKEAERWAKARRFRFAGGMA